MSKVENDFIVYPIPVPDTKSNEKSAHEVVTSVRAAFQSGKTKSLEFRRHELNKLLSLIDENTEAFVDCLKQDLGRPRHEALTFDIDICRNDIRRTLANLNEWAKPTYPEKPLANTLDTLKIINDPYGVVLILGCWNFPLTVFFAPLASAIAAGNCVIGKPSEIAEATAQLISHLLPKYLDDACYKIYTGDVKETAILLNERFDYIFFTGSTTIGKIIHAAANKYLTPVTLELGGKSPVYIDKTVDMEMAVHRILWGKCGNSGQTCIAPDYILCSEEVQKKFLPIAKKVIQEWYGKDVKSSPDYGRIINDKHYNRLVSYLGDKSSIALGGQTDPAQRFIEPTILINVSPNHPVMMDEIFGPILPIIIVQNMYEAVSFINAREKPLALYVFTKQKSVKEFFLDKTSSGGVCINDTLVHFAVDTLPFGGVGYSGMGSYHGKYSYDLFVHKKSVVDKDFQPLVEKMNSVRYPPFSNTKTKLMQRLLSPIRGLSFSWVKPVVTFCLGIAFIVIVQLIYTHVTNKHLL